MIGVIDNQMGNLRSVTNAVDQCGYDACLVDSATDWDDLTHLILPGVGNFRSASALLESSGHAGAIRDFAASGRPVLGICLGMQLLATYGTEDGRSAGLDLIPGNVTRLPEDSGLRIPHIGWNTLHVEREHAIFSGVKPDRDVYFVHAYAMHCDDPDTVLATTDYGGAVAAVVGRGNVVGFQFHPEKSQATGLRLLENFCDWDGAC